MAFVLAKRLRATLLPFVCVLWWFEALTRGVVPLLSSMNISVVTVGQNSGASVQQTPDCFLWTDRGSNTSIVYILTNGYGWWGQQVCGSVMPEMEHALVYNFNGDNSVSKIVTIAYLCSNRI